MGGFASEGLVNEFTRALRAGVASIIGEHSRRHPTQETTGTWAFQGDGLTWTAPGIPRQNNGAFLACGTGVPSVNVNLGA